MMKSGAQMGQKWCRGQQCKVFLNDKKWGASGAEMGLCYLVRQEKESQKSPQLHPKRNRNPKNTLTGAPTSTPKSEGDVRNYFFVTIDKTS